MGGHFFPRRVAGFHVLIHSLMNPATIWPPLRSRPDQLGFSDFFESSPSKWLSTSPRLGGVFMSVNTIE